MYLDRTSQRKVAPTIISMAILKQYRRSSQMHSTPTVTRSPFGMVSSIHNQRAHRNRRYRCGSHTARRWVRRFDGPRQAEVTGPGISPRCIYRESGQCRKLTVGTRPGRRRVFTNPRASTGAIGLQDVINRGNRDPACLILPIESVQRSCSLPLYPIAATLRISSRIHSVECRG